MNSAAVYIKNVLTLQTVSCVGNITDLTDFEIEIVDIRITIFQTTTFN